MKTIKFLGGFTLSFAILLFIITSCNTNSGSTNIIDNKPEVGITKIHTTKVGSTSANIVAPIGEVNIEVNASSASLLSPIDKVTVSVVGGSQKGEDDSAPFIIPLNFATEGEYELVAKAIDKNGLTSNEQTIKVTIVSGQDTDGQVSNAQPKAEWKTPVQSETVSGNVILEIEATDLNDPTISADDGSISKVEFFAGSHLLGEGDSPSANLYRMQWNSAGQTPKGTVYFDGEWDLTAVVTDNDGYTTSVTQKVKLDNAVSPPDIQANIVSGDIVPRPSQNADCTANARTPENGCYSGIITVKAAVQDETGSATVTLKWKNIPTQGSVAQGGVVGTKNQAPYTFEFNTKDLANNEVIVFYADIEIQNYSVPGTESNAIAIFNASSGSTNVLPAVSASWPQPTLSVVSGTDIVLEVTASDSDGTVKDVEFFAGSISLGKATSPERNKWRLSWDSTQPAASGEVFIDGRWELKAVATDDQGETSESYKTVTLNNAPEKPELNAEVKIKNIKPSPKILIDCEANVNDDPDFDPALLGCFTGSITIDVTVTDETGEAEVLLKYFNKSQSEGNVIGKSNAWPYKFEFDTTNHRNGDRITFSAVISSGEYSVQGQVSDEIVIYNEVLPPVLTIISPGAGVDDINGLMDVKVAVDNLTGNDYTLDLDGDNEVNHNNNAAEGILVEFLLQDGNGENKLPVADERISDVNLIQTMFAELDNKYETPQGFDTSSYANREYILKATAQFKRISTGEVFTLEDEVKIRTKNSGPVPPSVLILSPVNDPNGDPRMIRDPSDAYIVMQGTDDKGIVHMELEVFTGDLQYDETPSRFVKAFAEPVLYTKAALPVNYNAHPYLPNSPANTDYIVRVTTEDSDGNRTHQDTKVRLDRDTQSPYYLVQTGPDIDGDGSPDSTLNKFNSVATFAVVKQGGTLDGTERFDHLVKLDGEASYTPYTDTSSENSTFPVGLSVEKQTYYVQAQVITEDGHVYTTNRLGVIRDDDSF